MFRQSIQIGALVVASFVSACGTDQTPTSEVPMGLGDVCSKETRAPAFKAELPFPNDTGYTVKLLSSDPAPPKVGDNAWKVELDDTAGAPIAGAKITFVQLMVDHGHGGSKNPKIEELGAGQYSLGPVNFNMAGYWENYLTVSKDALATKLTIKVCVLE
ncbi:MAG TPA: FixH family protein [Polyangiaceae bacterium]|jgi:hypothetical protein|nr:FixH family protein [Polyangiaceae bacterium]